MAITDTWLTKKVAARQITIAKFANLLWLLDARGVAYIPALDYLVVSDLHFEKGSYLRSYGNPLPSLDSRATLTRLRQVIEDYQPETVISLGDSFHDKHSMSRMSVEDTQSLYRLVKQVPHWEWVEGNHDPDLPSGVPGTPREKLLYKDLCFQHEPDISPTESRFSFQTIGHYHPKARITVSRRRFSGKCFVVGKKTLVMPAFGQFTGGLDVNETVMTALVPASQRACYLMYDETIFKL